MSKPRYAIPACLTLLVTLCLTVGAASAAPQPSGTADPVVGVEHENVVDHRTDDHEAHPERELVPGLNKTLMWEMIWTIVVFAIFFGVLSLLVWPRVLKALQAREDKQRGDLEAAQRANADAKATLAAYEQKLNQAHAESRKLIDEARADAEALRQKLQAQTESDMQRQRERAASEIQAAKQEAVADLHAHAADLATAVAAKILHRQVQPADTDRLVQQSLEELEKGKAN